MHHVSPVCWVQILLDLYRELGLESGSEAAFHAVAFDVAASGLGLLHRAVRSRTPAMVRGQGVYKNPHIYIYIYTYTSAIQP